MVGPGAREAHLQAENSRLAEQVRALSGDEQLRREAAPWRDATPAERVAETWRLCALVPWFRSLWPEDVRARRRARGTAGQHAGDSRTAEALVGSASKKNRD
jgi:hypothetical protein